MIPADRLSVLAAACAIAAAAPLGVLTRVFVNPLFGPDGLSITGSNVAMFYDLPANMLGAFILGLLNGIKLRCAVPPLLALAVSTGYAGSVTSEFCLLSPAELKKPMSRAYAPFFFSFSTQRPAGSCCLAP